MGTLTFAIGLIVPIICVAIVFYIENKYEDKYKEQCPNCDGIGKTFAWGWRRCNLCKGKGYVYRFKKSND